VNAEQFAEEYAKRSGVTVEFPRDRGLFPESCDCDEDGCAGWQMAHHWEDAIV
jgi:hypothetical protein